MSDASSSKQNLRVSAGRLIRGDVIVRFATSEEIELHAEIERLQQRVAELEGMNNELSSECLSQFERIHGRKFGAGDVGATPPPNLGLISDRAPAMVKELLESYFWLPSLRPNTRYSRLQDDHDGEQVGWLSVTFGEDGDAWVGLDDDARFRMPGHGGGRSQYTRTALHILAEAIRTDNARDRAAETKTVSQKLDEAGFKRRPIESLDSDSDETEACEECKGTGEVAWPFGDGTIKCLDCDGTGVRPPPSEDVSR